MAPRIIPNPGNAPNVSHDAREAYETLKSGGVIIAPTDEGIQRIFAAKDRRQGHNIGIIGTYQQHREIHVLPESKFELTRVLTEDMGMIVGIIAKFDSQNLHPRLAALDRATLSQVTKGDMVSIAVPEGPFLRELGRLCDTDPQGLLMFGTSANLTGQGQRFRVEDIEPPVLAHVDLVVDYGLQKWHIYGRGGVNFDAENMKVLRMGAGGSGAWDQGVANWGIDRFNQRMAMIGNKRISIRTLGQMRIFLFKFEEKEDSDVAGRYCCLGRWPEGLWWLRSYKRAVEVIISDDILGALLYTVAGLAWYGKKKAERMTEGDFGNFVEFARRDDERIAGLVLCLEIKAHT
ncbi:hypothetical protein C345_03298 [Cryptococcus neoformans A2-102-5]|nr:hypothetical protein C346_03416 [Cryptococcus neoformans var. grubii D17-1]OXG95773.1 hypothetical protein C345_03298 [Cryptococcus neoformans var. grubii A2-102-5]